jgi:hypothetical protein
MTGCHQYLHVEGVTVAGVQELQNETPTYRSVDGVPPL